MKHCEYFFSKEELVVYLSIDVGNTILNEFAN